MLHVVKVVKCDQGGIFLQKKPQMKIYSSSSMLREIVTLWTSDISWRCRFRLKIGGSNTSAVEVCYR